jgi:phthalate 4,5-dioxygenase oxygenase subunit
MTSAAENELLTRVGPGTPMGNFMRQFWVPAIMSSELLPDAAPTRLMILGEKLIAFRDTNGKVGIFDHRCPHRCASLFFARNEEGGLRCAYHGWKFDATGQCTDMPNVPERLAFASKIQAKAYPAVERGGLIYIYMGERQLPPPLPEIEPTLCPEDDTMVICRQRECNWLQAMEGDLDTSHFGFLHGGLVDAADLDPTTMDRFQVKYRAPEYYVRDTEWGTMYAAHRPAEADETYYRFAQFVLPFWTLYPNGMLTHNVAGNIWVPMDDTHTMVFNVGWKQRVAPLAYFKNGEPIPGLERRAEYLPNSNDWFGRWRSAVNKDNDYMVDRDIQRDKSFTGISGVTHQDMAVTESMGDIVDRTMEHLAVSDRMIMITRMRLLALVEAFAKDGTLPAMLDTPSVARYARGGDAIAPASQDWLDVYDQNMQRAEGPLGKANAAE